MAATPSPDNLYVGKGEIYLDRFDDDGNKTGELHLGNCRSLAITFDDDVIESFNHMDSEAGLYKRTIRRRIPNLAIVGEENDSAPGGDARAATTEGKKLS